MRLGRFLGFNGNKKGFDFLYIVIILFVIAILLPTFVYIIKSLNTVMGGATEVDKAVDTTQELSTGFTESGDIIFAMMYFALYLGAIILAYFLDTHPIFLIGGVILFIIGIWVAMITANVYVDVTATGAIGDQMVEFPIMSFIMHWYGELSLLLGALVLIVLYKRNT